MDLSTIAAKISPVVFMVVGLLEKFGYTDIAQLLQNAGSSVVAAVLALYAIYDYVSKNFLHKAEPPAAKSLEANGPFKILK